MEVSKMYNNEITEENLNKISTLANLIDSIVFLDDNTVGITLNKNLAIYNEGNTINITKGYSVNIASQIHMNPEISLKDFYNNPSNIKDICDEAQERKRKQLTHINNKEGCK